MDHIRNFCIIAHIDHGKSTLADRLIQRCGGVEDRDFRDQILDSMDLERERGITIKSNTVTLPYTAKDGKTYALNLIDTPGHVDFSHEVRRSLMSLRGRAARGRRLPGRRGADRRQPLPRHGVRPGGRAGHQQDRPALGRRRPRDARRSTRDLGLDPFEVDPGLGQAGHRASTTCWRRSSRKLPPPKGDPQAPLQALIFDAQYDSYRGAVLLVPALRRHAQGPDQSPPDALGRRAQGRGGRQPAPQAGAGRPSCRRATWAT